MGTPGRSAWRGTLDGRSGGAMLAFGGLRVVMELQAGYGLVTLDWRVVGCFVFLW